MGKASENRDLSGNRKDPVKNPGFPANQQSDDNTISSEVKNAQAAGIGALGRSDENQIEKMIDREQEKDDDVY